MRYQDLGGRKPRVFNMADHLCGGFDAKLAVIGLTGKDGGLLGKRADVAIIVPETETFKIQELHLPIYHALCLMLEEAFFEE